MAERQGAESVCPADSRDRSRTLDLCQTPQLTMPPSFRVLDDIAIADIAFEAIGNSPSELCLAAAQALIETLADPRTVTNTWHQTIELENETLAEILFAWLSELVYWKDADGVVFSRCVGIGPFRGVRTLALAW